MKKWWCLFLLLGSEVYCLSLNLLNNSSYKLRAVVQSNDGSFIVEKTLKPNESFLWNDALGAFKAPRYSQTPFVVIWYCPEGTAYSICTDLVSGSTAAAESCDGLRACKPEERKKEEAPKEGLKDPHPQSEFEFPPEP